MICFLCSLGGYLLGSINPSYFISRIKGFDIRKKGTGNAGATNAMFTLGFGSGVIIMIFDILKAYIAVTVPHKLLSFPLEYGILSGVSCAVGHVFPFYMRFRGGKGTACLAGIVLGLTPVLFLPMAVCAFIIGLIVNYVSFLPALAAVVYPTLYYLDTKHTAGALILMTLGPLLLWSHRKNAGRRKNGEESPFRSVIFGRNLDECVERKKDRESD